LLVPVHHVANLLENSDNAIGLSIIVSRRIIPNSPAVMARSLLQLSTPSWLQACGWRPSSSWSAGANRVTTPARTLLSVPSQRSLLHGRGSVRSSGVTILQPASHQRCRSSSSMLLGDR
jgi:hypothetical protein